jgi:hypothetical protein
MKYSRCLVSFATYYCSKRCQLRDCDSHKCSCKEVQQLFRAVTIFEVFDHYHAITYQKEYALTVNHWKRRWALFCPDPQLTTPHTLVPTSWRRQSAILEASNNPEDAKSYGAYRDYHEIGPTLDDLVAKGRCERAGMGLAGH